MVAKSLVYLIWVAAAVATMVVVYRLRLPGWGTFLLEVLVVFVWGMSYDGYRYWRRRREQARHPERSAA